jgi:hypothetical protein
LEVSSRRFSELLLYRNDEEDDDDDDEDDDGEELSDVERRDNEQCRQAQVAR